MKQRKPVAKRKRFELKLQLWHGGWNWTNLSVDIPRAMLSQFADGEMVRVIVESLRSRRGGKESGR